MSILLHLYIYLGKLRWTCIAVSCAKDPLRGRCDVSSSCLLMPNLMFVVAGMITAVSHIDQSDPVVFAEKLHLKEED